MGGWRYEVYFTGLEDCNRRQARGSIRQWQGIEVPLAMLAEEVAVQGKGMRNIEALVS